MTELREFQDGEVISGTRYRVLRVIGIGGMGSVYEVEHIELGKRFVLKALLRELTRRDDLVQRLRNEWRALARLQHVNIVNVTDAGTSGGVPYYVMDRLDGETLAAFLRKKRRLHVLEAVNIAAAVLEALSAAHEIGIIHRDVKPANVFIVQGGGVKLLDFGIAKIADATGVVTARGLAVGTPRYMSPEQARGERVDGRSDVYATALILFEMIAGVGPFDDAHDANELLLAHMAREAPLLSSLLPGVSPELERLVSRMLAKDCRQRPAHAREAAEQLRDFALRLRSLPATDAPTGRAGYGAETLPTARDATGTQDALTQRLALAPATTQVTLSAITGQALSVSAVPNTTFVSAPAFDGTTTLLMSVAPRTPSPVPAPLEQPERTELLGELSAGPSVPPDTRTLLPLPERARPVSLTPPPVVDSARPEGSAAPSRQRVGRWAALGAAGLGVLMVTGFLLRRAALPSAGVAAPAVAAQTTAFKPPVLEPPLAPSEVESGSQAPAASAAASAAPAAAPSASARPVSSASARLGGTPATSASAPNSGIIFDAKHLSSPGLSGRILTRREATGAFLRSARAPGTAAPPRAAGPALPGSGL